MKVLQINCVYKKGSTGKITYDLHKGLLEAGIDSVVCYGRGEVVNEPSVYKTCPEWYSKFNHLWSRITGMMYGGCFFSTNRLISIIKKEHPDVVHLQCINGYFVNIYRLITWLKKNHIKTVLTLHAEFMYTANCGHALECDKWRFGCNSCDHFKEATESFFIDHTKKSFDKMWEAFRGFNDNLIVTSVSPWLMERAKQSEILGGKKHFVVMNGLDTSVFHPVPYGELKRKLGLENKKIIFHVSANFNDRSNHIKGGYYILELAKKRPDVVFIVAGPHSEIKDLPNNVILLGLVKDQNLLAQYYSMANLTVLTSRKETFSMPTAESLCCGTPVVGFEAGGPERIAMPEYSDFVPYGDLNALEKSIRSFLSKEADIGISDALKKYSIETMRNNYLHIYEKL